MQGSFGGAQAAISPELLGQQAATILILLRMQALKFVLNIQETREIPSSSGNLKEIESRLLVLHARSVYLARANNTNL